MRIDQDGVFGESGVDPVQGRGCCTSDLARALKNIGFKTGAVWYSIPAQDAWSRLNDEFGALHADLQAGVPSIVCMRFDDLPQAPEHFRLVLVRRRMRTVLSTISQIAGQATCGWRGPNSCGCGR